MPSIRCFWRNVARCNSAIKSIGFGNTKGGGLCKWVFSDRFGGGGGGILRIGVPKFDVEEDKGVETGDCFLNPTRKFDDKMDVGFGGNDGVIKD